MKIILTETQFKRVILKKENLTEGVMWDRLRDKLYDLTIMVRSIGYNFRKLPNLYRLKKSGDEEGYKKEIDNLKSFVQNLLEKHPKIRKKGYVKKGDEKT